MNDRESRIVAQHDNLEWREIMQAEDPDATPEERAEVEAMFNFLDPMSRGTVAMMLVDLNHGIARAHGYLRVLTDFIDHSHGLTFTPEAAEALVAAENMLDGADE